MTRLTTPDWTRRATLGGLAAGAAAGLAGLGRESTAAEPPPEVTKLVFLTDPSAFVLCWAPQYLAMDFLKFEGFTEIETRAWLPGMNESEMLGDGYIDFSSIVATDLAVGIDRGAAVTGLAGLHVGCIETFASDRVPTLGHLKGARLLSTHEGGLEYIFLSSVLAFVGLDPTADVEWVYEPDYLKWPALFAEGKVDVVNAFTSLNYAMREQGVGHVILNTTLDDPWRNFFCCMVAGNRDFVRRHPIATKKVLRAVAKAHHLCVTDRQAAAKRLVELGASDRHDYILRALQEIPYGAWREFDPAATMRFFSLRLREVGLIEGSPREILERGTDFRALEELRREMKS